MIKPKKNPVTKLVAAGVKAVSTKAAAKAAKTAQKKNYKEKVKVPSKRLVKIAKQELKDESRALKAANKPTKASKTFIGSNKNLSPSVRRDIIVNQTKPARPNRERGGSLKTLRKQGKTSSTQSPLRNLKPMEDVPAKVSARSSETIARLMKEQTKKKSK
jgi:hypothetical protein